MKGYCTCAAIWLFLLIVHLADARKISYGTTLQHPLAESSKVHQALAAIDLEAAKTGQHVKVASAHQALAGHHGAQGSVSEKGGKSSHGHEAHKKGAEGQEKHVVSYGQNAGKKHSSEQGAGHQAQHHQSEGGKEGHKYQGGDHHKKTGFTKGYHGKYHKDEYRKLDKYWKNGKERGQFEKYGEHGEHFHKEGSKHSKGSKSSKSAEADQHGKKGKHAKGHQSAQQKGHEGHKGYQKQTAHSSQFAKKGGHAGGKQHAYKVHE